MFLLLIFALPAILIIGIFSLALFLLWWNQGSLLYIPEGGLTPWITLQGPMRSIRYNPEGYRSPKEFNYPHQDVYLRARDGVAIHGWLMLHPGDPRKRNSLLIFHGNAGNIGHRLPELMSFFDRLEMNIFAIDYRGYGNSEGVPSEQGIALDAQVALDFMLNHPEIDPRRVFLYGSSLGGAVAIRLAHLCSQKIAGLVVENTFTSIDEMAMLVFSRAGLSFFNHLRIPLYFFLTSHWNNAELVRDIRIPILFLSGMKDELIPPSHMQYLYDVCCSPEKAIVFFPNGTHNCTYESNSEKFFHCFIDFVNKAWKSADKPLCNVIV